jgi:uncharacterized protein
MATPTLVYLLVVALMIVGIVGSVIPAIPGPTLILLGVGIWGFFKGSFTSIQTPLIVSVIVFILCFIVDNLSGYLGAKKAGASNWGQIGAFVGLILGFFGLLPALPIGGPLVGIIFGPFIGAVIGEYLYQRNFNQAVKAGVGIVAGMLVGNVLQGVLAFAAVIVFLTSTWSQVF